MVRIGRRLRDTFVALLVFFAPHAAADQPLWRFEWFPDSRPGKPQPWAFHLYGGWLLDSPMTKIHYAPWSARWTGATIFGIDLSRRIATLGRGLDFELEIGGARRPQENVWEFHTAIRVRWDRFPWNDLVFTTVAVSPLGFSYVDKVSVWERKQAGGDRVSRLINVFSTEITLAHPALIDVPLVLRLHHRSSVFGLYGGTHNAATFATVGLRIHFR